MTAPSWVRNALAIPGLSLESLNSPSLVSQLGSGQDLPGDLQEESVVKGRWINSDGKPSLVYTYTSKGSPGLAWTTCHKCPEPRRPSVDLVAYFPEPNVQRGYRFVRRYTIRCAKCNRIRTNKTRAKRLLNDIRMVEDHLSLGVRWVTLTAPNYPCRDRGLLDFKKKVKKFRGRKNYQAKVVGSAEFYEWTLHPDDQAWSNPICWNIHLHALWIGDYWHQPDLLKSWGEGGARIEDARTQSRRCLNYVISYAKKQQASGIRAQNRTGCLYGPAFAELKSAAMLLAELDSADDVQD